MKILVADKFEEAGLEGLRALGAEVLYAPDLHDGTLTTRVEELRPQVLVVRSTQVQAPMMQSGSLGLIVRAGAGVNTIDVETANKRGILVANCPGKNSQAVAELAFGLMLAIDRRIPDNVIQLRQGKWNKKRFSKAKGLCGRTLGLIGMGKIGQEMVPRAKAFGMNVVAQSRWMTPDVAAALNIGRAQSLVEIAALSDVVSVHVSLTPETRGMLGEEFFSRMKPGATFINTSRAEVVVQDAMLKALDEGRIFAGLDVFEGEPSTGEAQYEGPLKDHANVYCTHHIGASTDQAQEAIAHETVRIVREFMQTGIAPNVVNVREATLASHLLVVRHVDRVGVLAHVLGVLRDEGINVQEMENIILGGAQAAIAQMAIDKEPSPSALLRIKMDDHVFDASVFAIER
jgi:D-3-phosphoglycerate dehydrogenase